MFHEYSASVHYEEGDEERISSMREQRDGTVRGGGGMQTIVSHRQLPSLQLPTDGTKQKVVGAQNLALKWPKTAKHPEDSPKSDPTVERRHPSRKGKLLPSPKMRTKTYHQKETERRKLKPRHSKRFPEITRQCRHVVTQCPETMTTFKKCVTSDL